MIRRLVIIPLLFVALDAIAQEQASVSPLVSFDYGKMLFVNRSAGVLYPVPGTANGNSNCESVGVGAEFSMPEILKGHIGLMGLIEGIYSRGYFDFDNYSVSGIDRKVLIEASALWNAHPFSIRSGPWISQSISTNVYENDSSGKNITPSNANSSATHFGISAGIAYYIPDFPIRPEINTHLDLTEVGDAGLNAFSVGISLSYSPPVSTNQVSSPSASERVETRSTPVVPSRVRFLVDRSEIIRDVPLERVEMRVKQYTMEDSSNAPPRVTQWVLESYHLPQISVLCEVDRDASGELHLMKDTQRLAAFSIPNANPRVLTFDTTFDLDKSSVWQDALSHLNINDGNRVIAELQTTNASGIDTTRDTLLLPPVDTSRAVRTTVKKQFRFYLSDRFSEFDGGSETLDLLIERIKSLLDSNVHITISEPHKPRSAKYFEMRQRLLDALGANSMAARKDESAEVPDELLVVLDF